ncbi:Protein of unknown function [Gryllus bimaculatus]|nr:Protein of unknown function [Gryllus bimaculatus]
MQAPPPQPAGAQQQADSPGVLPPNFDVQRSWVPYLCACISAGRPLDSVRAYGARFCCRAFGVDSAPPPLPPCRRPARILTPRPLSSSANASARGRRGTARRGSDPAALAHTGGACAAHSGASVPAEAGPSESAAATGPPLTPRRAIALRQAPHVAVLRMACQSHALHLDGEAILSD